MADEKKVESTPEVKPEVGSSANLLPDPPKPAEDPKPAETVGGESGTTDGKKGTEETVLKSTYEELEKKLGSQGEEMGGYKTFLKEISPLLDKLNEQPELVQAIVDGKVDTTLAKAALEGKISIAEAKTVSEAHEKVKEEVGKEKIKEMKPEEIEKKVAEKLSADMEKMGDKISATAKKEREESEELREYKTSLDKFITETDDMAEYAEAMQEYADDHPELDDPKVIYNAVKGIALQKKADEDKEAGEGEDAKKVAANAAGGGSQGATVVQDKNVVDELISNKGNPNAL